MTHQGGALISINDMFVYRTSLGMNTKAGLITAFSCVTSPSVAEILRTGV
jgi:hypothetical protein